MSIDVDDLVANISTGIYGDDRMTWSTIEAATTALSQLVAEVERLRGVNADLRLMVDGLETAAHDERAAVVAWLQCESESLMSEEAGISAYVVRTIAGAV